VKKELIYSDPFLKGSFTKDPLVYRYYNCSLFNIYFKVNVLNNILNDFKFFVVGSFFVSLLLDNFAENAINKDLEIVNICLSTLESEISNHKYFTNLDKQRSLKMVSLLRKIINSNAQKTT